MAESLWVTRTPTPTIFLVQNLYYGAVVDSLPPQDSDNFTLPSHATTANKADLADPSRFTEIYMKPSRYG
jgi:hypothetical protein